MLGKIAVAFLLTSSAAYGQFYSMENSSIHTDAVPGEYFFNTGVTAIKHNDYVHAVAMYKVAASWAYKPAEFNLGVIFAKGEGGVPLDLPQSYAWMTLAAERHDAQYVAARDRIKAALTAEQVQESEKMLVDMRKIYGDDVALRRAKVKWHEVLTHSTCSHVGFTGCNMEVGNGGASRSNPARSVKGLEQGAAGYTTATDLIGGSGTDGSIAYSDLRMTDNPYDPRFNGVVTVGAIKAADAKPSDESTEQPKPDN